MPESTPRTRAAAVKRYRHHLQRTLSCLSQSVWVTGPGPGDQNTMFASGDPVALRRRHGKALYLKATQSFHIVQVSERPAEYKVKTDGYAYTVTEAKDLASELFAWHWHPGSRPDPHLHIGRGHPDHSPLAKLHVPTGRVLFEAVARFLIVDLDVRAIDPAWESVIQDVTSRVKQAWTWS